MRHLDTSVLIDYLRGSETIAAQLTSYLPEAAVSSLVLAELLYGARASVRATENTKRIQEFLQIVEVVDFDQGCAEAYSRIRFALRQKGLPIGEMDMLIAAVALANEAILVTHNTKHFENIEGLLLEDWPT